MQNKPQAYSVTAITRMIKTTLEESFNNIWVEGEISGYLHHSSGHRYLSLKDDNAVIKVTIWRSMGSKLKFEPENGQKVLIFGDISLYEKGGNYQLNCRKMVPVGVGELELAFRQLYEKLSEEGLFADELKKEIPQYAQKVGVVTSPTGAAIRDIIQISRRRNRSVELIIYPAQVQGKGSENTIAAGVEYFNSRDDIDVIITGRGGGSMEDLFCFNEEKVVRAIYNSKIPVISAVGHEIDTTLADLVSDLRAPTPSAAAELAVWSKAEFSNMIKLHLSSQSYNLNIMVENARDYLISLLSRPIFKKPIELILQKQQYLDNLVRILSSSGKNSFEKAQNRLSLALSRLETLSPLKILQRGYSVTNSQPGDKLLRSVGEVAVDDEVETILSDGRFRSKVIKVSKGKI